jgi:hypothetical protein
LALPCGSALDPQAASSLLILKDYCVTYTSHTTSDSK